MARLPLVAVAAIVAGLIGPSAAAAQQPSPPKPPGALDPAKRETPQMPVLRLPIELAGITVDQRKGIIYDRIGMRPTEVRVGTSEQMTGATWEPFTEGPTTTRTVNGRTVTNGSFSGGIAGGDCGSGQISVTAYVQFRARDLQGRLSTSNVKGDRRCFNVGG